VRHVCRREKPAGGELGEGKDHNVNQNTGVKLTSLGGSGRTIDEHEHLSATEEPAQKRGTSLFSLPPADVSQKGKASAQFGDFGKGGMVDNDEIRLTSANQFKIGWDSGDLRTRARGPRAQCSLTQRTDGSPKMVGYRQAVSACRTELL
jgi:hypothetical protein